MLDNPVKALVFDVFGTVVARDPVDFVVVRSDKEGIVVKLDVVPVEEPETVY